MELNKILSTINQSTQKDKDKTTPIRGNVDKVAEYFVKQLDKNIRTLTHNEHGLEITDENKNVIEMIIQYACYDPSFLKQKGGYSFRKGLLIVGNYGSGKTELMRVYKQVLDRMNIKCGIVTTTFVTQKYNEFNESTRRIMGEEGIKSYLNPHDETERIFDDFGSEAFLSDYGNKKSAMIEILEARYKNRQNGLKTHLTTNLTLTGIKEKYGERMYSRFKEMFNVITLGTNQNSKDFRK